MFRLLLITLMLMQPIQWAWAVVHITSDAAHAVTHKSVKETVKAIESVTVFSLSGDAADGHASHDNHIHNTIVLGLSNDIYHFSHLLTGGKLVNVEAPLFNTSLLADIERPKWIATR